MSASVTWNGRLLLVSGVRYSGMVSSKPCVRVSILPPFGLASRIDCAAAFGSFSAASTALVVADMKRFTRSALALDVLGIGDDSGGDHVDAVVGELDRIDVLAGG